ncbi:hypothetical protein HQ560_12640 [bacterium]|nr:hypothetical protein [bacterium]
MRTRFILALAFAVSASAADVVIQGKDMSARDKKVNPADAGWNGLVVMNGEGGFEEWTASVEKAGPHFIHFLYASGQSRPCTLSVNGKAQKGSALGEKTGGFYHDSLKWRVIGPVDLAAGKNRIRLDAKGHMPHLRGLVVSTDKKLAKADVFGPIRVAAKPPAKRPAKRTPKPVPTFVHKTDETAADATRKALLAQGIDKIVFVKRQAYTSNHYYTEYLNSRWTPGGNLCVLSLADGSVREVAPKLQGGVFGRHDLSFDGTKVVFGYKKDKLEGYRLYEVNVDGTGLKQLTVPPKNEGELIKRYKLSGGYHHGTDDMHPCYLPDGGVAFISTRCQYGILCNGPDDFTTTVLYRIDGDGSNMQRLSNSSVSEAAPALTEDGRILYTRWEYFDKGAVSVKCLWAMHPDGGASVEIYGADISLPPTLIFGRSIPGSRTQYVVCGTPHYPQAGVGTVIRLDMSQDIRSRKPMTYMTPYVDIRSEGGFHFKTDDTDRWTGDRSGRGPLFREPYPLSAKEFLVAHKPAGPAWTDGKAYALYLLDETGATRLVYRDPDISCWSPMPLRPRKRPPVLQRAGDPKLAAKNQAVCIVTDIYHGMEDVERGSIKYIRILEQIPRPWAARRRWGGDGYDQQHVTITKDTHLALKVQHGVVPVEDDGSAHFTVPAKANISLQALDANYMAVQTERTYVYYAPGEQRACIGCHETPQSAAPSVARLVKAVRRAPSVPGPQPGETQSARALHYITDVQPVLDKHCVKCHSGDEPKAGLTLTGELTNLFCVSYENLVPSRRGGKIRHRRAVLGPVIGENHPKTGNVHYLPARSLGSHASILVAMLAKGKVKLKDPKAAARADVLAKQHKDIALKPEELIKITNWVDTNCQYYGSWWGRRNIQHKTHPNFRPVPDAKVAIRMTSPIPEDKR